MTKIDEKLVSKLEKLSKLKIKDDEKAKIIADLNAIVGMFDKLNELNTDGVEALSHISGTINVRREDIVANELTNKQALINTKTKKDGFIAVPKFLKPNKSK